MIMLALPTQKPDTDGEAIMLIPDFEKRNR